eukprot:TRINITY_DN18319_c0_g1_i1.p1 TRINITY_DN18319_c0_g1~~TRINITY_DN18319_c0_g1_i1.p1  ORF type:complete len:431 (+),score=74.74 TRINITY_DN18319_c0_g1_i1:45-1295(+)
MNRLSILERQTSGTQSERLGMLNGLRVVELATVIAAPACCALMADFGAEVIKVERPGGDGWRGDRAAKTPNDPSGGPHFAQNNRGKKSIVLDLKNPQHLEALMKLLATADIFVTNVRMQGLAKMGLDFDSLHAKFPKLIYGILTAWGMSGPKQNDPGYDVGAFWAASGLQDFSKPTDDGHVGQFPPGIGDHMTSLQLLSGIGLALWYRDRTGKGQLVEASLLRSGIWGMAYPLLNTSLNPGSKFIREPRTNHYRPTFNVYKCSDGVWLQLLGLDIGRFDAGLCKTLGVDEKEFASLDGKGKIKIMDAKFITQPSSVWEAKLNENKVWYQKAVQLDDVLRDPQAHAVGAFKQLPGMNFPFILSPVQLSCDTDHGPRSGPPQCGEHTSEVLQSLGYPSSTASSIASSTKKWARSHTSD